VRAAFAGALVLASASAVSCGDAPGRTRSAAPGKTVASGTLAVGSSSPTGVQVLSVHAVSVAARSSADVSVGFQGAADASLLVLGERAGRLEGRFGRTRLAHASLLGSSALVASLRSPRDGALVLRNPTDSGISVRVIATAQTRRRLTVSTPAEPTRPGTPVRIVVALTEASPHDRPVVAVRDDTAGRTVLTARPRKVGEGRWLLTFTPGRAGDYTASAWVGGPRSRAAHDAFFVMDRPPQQSRPATRDDRSG
jgi:hypothetical protein